MGNGYSGDSGDTGDLHGNKGRVRGKGSKRTEEIGDTNPAPPNACDATCVPADKMHSIDGRAAKCRFSFTDENKKSFILVCSVGARERPWNTSEYGNSTRNTSKAVGATPE